MGEVDKLSDQEKLQKLRERYNNIKGSAKEFFAHEQNSDGNYGQLRHVINTQLCCVSTSMSDLEIFDELCISLNRVDLCIGYINHNPDKARELVSQVNNQFDNSGTIPETEKYVKMFLNLFEEQVFEWYC